MRRIAKLFHHTTADRSLLIKTGLLLLAVRIGLWVLPFRTVSCMLNRVSRPRGRRRECVVPSAERIAWGVSVMSRYVPKATCLTQALTALALLNRSGYSSELRIGVARSEPDQIEAHAWVENQGRIIIGASSAILRYTPLLPRGKAP